MKITGRLLVSIILLASLQPDMQAQSESFADFRKRVLSDFNEFRSSILENYDKFLEGAWENYDQMKGEKSNPKPKPKHAPVADSSQSLPTAPGKNVPEKATVPQAKPEVTQTTPEKSPEATAPAPLSADMDRFSLANIPMELPHIEYNIARRLNNKQEFGAHWRGLTQTDIQSQLIPALRKLVTELGLNDYLTYLTISAYVDSRFPKSHSSSRTSLKHYILANMGYDIRLGTNSAGDAMLLIPFNQMVYARPYLNIDNKKYFIFADESIDLTDRSNLRISTCALPSDADTGKQLDLLLTNLNLPYKPYHYSISFGDIKIEGELNETIMPLLYRYPQMPTADFAKSTILPDVRRQIVKQIKEQLAGKDEKTAVNTLLQFVQKGFEYATDEDYHGFEKPYFLEETLFYPKNDCEDRAIFYTYMLWEVLGLPAQLICYPGHESASVALSEPVKGTSYSHSGSTFYISDPTFIGAVTGQCMPEYVTTAPQIDYTYK